MDGVRGPAAGRLQVMASRRISAPDPLRKVTAIMPKSWIAYPRGFRHLGIFRYQMGTDHRGLKTTERP